MVLKSLWKRVLPQRKRRESVQLDPVEQLTLRFLATLGEHTKESIHTEVNATRAAAPADVEVALARLVDAGLVVSSSRLEGGQSETLFTASKKAAKLKGHIPLEPQGVTEFYL